MKKIFVLLVKIVTTVVLIGVFGLVTHSISEYVFPKLLYLLLLLAFAVLLIYGSVMEYLEIPGIPGSARWKSATEAQLFWEVYSSVDSGSGEFIILRKEEGSGAFVEVGRSFGPTFIDATVDSTKTNYYQVFEGKDALEKKNRFFTPILELKPFKR